MGKLIYCATPSRIVQKMDEVMDFVTNLGHGPLHPFKALPYERFEGGPVGREKSMEYCLRLIDISDEFWMFGVSNGTLEEVVHALKLGKPVELHLDSYDAKWREFYKQLGPRYGNPLDNILGP